MAARRSVSFTRQLAMLRKVEVPSAYRAATAIVMAASGMWLKSMSTAFNTPFERASIQFSPMVMVAPICCKASTKRTSPWMLSRPTPSTRTGPPPMAPAARKYEADEASPSTWIVPGL